MSVKTFTVSEFKAHCTEVLREVEETGVLVEVTRHGKKVAQIAPVGRDNSKTLADWMGKGAGVVYSPSYDPDGPACPTHEWEAERQ